MRLHLHLLSDSTGETLENIAKAALAQYDDVETIRHFWPMVRTEAHLERILQEIAQNPGLVLFTLVNDQLRGMLQDGCRRLQLPCIPVLEPVIGALGSFFGLKSRGLPGRQHELDAEYFERIDAMSFALAHDDGQSSWTYDQADVILVGVSRTSKTPTCIYLANRGIKAANVPVVPNCPLPPELLTARRPLIVGLTKDPVHLVQVRRNRLLLLSQDQETDYVDPEIVRQEVAAARRLFAEHDWPVIDVSRRSIEETAATIIQLLGRQHGGTAGRP